MNPQVKVDRARRLFEAGRNDEAETALRSILQDHPRCAEAWRGMGVLANERGRYEDAISHLQRAVSIVAKSEYLSNLAYSLLRVDRIDEAEHACRRALKADPRSAPALLCLGIVLESQDRFDDAISFYRRSLALQRANPAIASLGWILQRTQRSDEAIAVYERAIPNEFGDREVAFGLGTARLARGEYAAGWPLYEARPSRFINRFTNPAGRQYRGESLNGQTVAVANEQGYGDIIMFSRFAPLVAARGGRVVMVMPVEMCRLLRTVPGVAEVVSGATGCDAWQAVGTLPLVLGVTRPEDIPNEPYLCGDVTPWQPFLDGLSGLRVGVCWAGKRTAKIDRVRSLQSADMLPILTTPGCSFVPLQKEPQDLPEGVMVHDVSDRITDWADTAGLIAGLDLVITVDTAVAHLAGALGKPVWLMNRFDTDWRWGLCGETTPWYPSMRIFRQTRLGDWPSVVADVRCELIEMAREWRLPGPSPDSRRLEKRHPILSQDRYHVTHF